MPLKSTARWVLLHNWNSNHWENWTEKMLIDELMELKKFYRKEKIPYSFKEFINEIERRGGIELNDKIIDFHKVKKIIKTWKHVTTTCTHYVRKWLAQDESRLECEFDIPCNHFNVNCDKYEPMLKARTLEQILKQDIEWSVS